MQSRISVSIANNVKYMLNKSTSDMLRILIFLSALVILNSPWCFCQSDTYPPDQGEKRAVIDSVSKWLREYYVFPDVAEQCIERMNQQFESGAYDKKMKMHVEFIRLLNADLLEVSNDKHLKVLALFGVEEEADELPLAEAVEYNHFLKRGNYGFINVMWKRDNIGLLEFRAFCNPDVAGEKVRTVMGFLSDMDALIIDLRSMVMGGRPEMVNLICSYFFEEPTLLNRTYFRQEDIMEEDWTFPIKDQPALRDIPLYILVDEDVFSAGEAFTYSLQALGRATVIGEKTGGGAHLTRPFRIGTRFEAKIPWGRAINPISNSNWEGTGVVPDIQVKSENALDRALELAKEEALKRRELREQKDLELVEEFSAQLDEIQKKYKAGNLDEAIQILEKVLKKGSGSELISPEMIDDAGHYYLDHDMIELARLCFNFNIKFNPDPIFLSYYYYSLAEADQKAGEKGNAKINLKKSLELDPNNQWAKKMLREIDDN